MLFAKEPMRRWPDKTSPLFPKGTKLRGALALALHAHAPIAKLIGTGVGYKLMLMESVMLIQALHAFARLGITALQLYDSVLGGSCRGVGAESSEGLGSLIIADPSLLALSGALGSGVSLRRA